MNPDTKVKFDIVRYLPLGLVANPFALPETTEDFSSIDLEIASQSNALLAMLAASSQEPDAKPIVVTKSVALPQFYPNRAISAVERSLATDDGLGVLHAYVLLFMMRIGRVRATLQTVAERLAFRDFPSTLACYVAKVLEEPDERLISYQVFGEDGLDAFRARFDIDPAQTIDQVFGLAKVERRPELAEAADIRTVRLETDVDEAVDVDELDETVGTAPGTDVVLADEDFEGKDDDRAVLDYLVEYTKVHLSPVVARALRVYHDRGLAALSAELCVTKAPRKTLSALMQLSHVRFKKVFLMYDGFDSWKETPQDLRAKVTGTLSELRWMLESDACVVMILGRDTAPDLEEQFGSGKHLDWDFPGLTALHASPDAIDPEMIDRWLAAATAPEAPPLTVADPVLSVLLAEADGSLAAFSLAACIAIEHAASSGASALNEAALQAGRAARWEEEGAQ